MQAPVSPAAQAAALRAKAAALTGDQQAYCLWLAEEWERTAARHPPTPARQAGLFPAAQAARRAAAAPSRASR